MLLDIRTVLIGFCASTVACLLIVVILWLENRRRFNGLFYWVIDLAFQSLAMLLIGLRGKIPDVLSIVASNTLVMAGLAASFCGLNTFFGQPCRRAPKYFGVLLAGFALVHAHYTFTEPNLPARNVNISTGIAAFSGAVVWLAFRGLAPQWRPIARPLGVSSLAIGLLGALRLLGTILAPPSNKDYLRSNSIEATGLLLYQVSTVFFTFTILLLVNRRLQADVRVQQEKFSKAFHSSPNATVVSRVSDGVITETNDAFVKLSGFSHTEAGAATNPEVNRWLNPIPRDTVLSRLAAEGSIRETEVQLHSKSGTALVGLFSAELVMIGAEPYVVSYIADITARKQGERDLQKSETNYRASFECAAVGQAVLDLSGRFQRVNETLAKMLEYTREELVGMSFLDVTHPDERDSARAVRQELTTTRQQPQRLEKRYLSKGGSTVWGEVTLSLLKSGDEQCHGILAHIVDISDRKEAESRATEAHRDRERLTAELHQAHKLEAVGRLAAGIAHEINTPIQYISDNLHFLRDAYTALSQTLVGFRTIIEQSASSPTSLDLVRSAQKLEQEADLEYLLRHIPSAADHILEGVQRVTTVVRTMKEFAHPGTKTKSKADLNRAIENTLTIARHEYKQTADIVLSLSPLPPVYCYPTDLNQVLLNLIVNAAHAVRDAASKTEQRGTIKISSQLCGDQVQIEVADTGLGIPEEIRERIFEPFFTTKPIGQGTGQGLAISRAIVVTKHGGRLTFKSTVGEGTTFTVLLPVE